MADYLSSSQLPAPTNIYSSMASLKLSLSLSPFHRPQNPTNHSNNNQTIPLLRITYSIVNSYRQTQRLKRDSDSDSFPIRYRYSASDEEDDESENRSFDEAVALFNRREYYDCHDFLEALWNRAEEPSRTLFHGILQCAVGFHHLFNQNHKGAMMELGEGLCKLRKMGFKSGPFHQFERDISRVLDFLYHTQIELAACDEDLCEAMDRSERSYKLLGGYAAGQQVYELQQDPDDNRTVQIVFSPNGYRVSGDKPMVKLPTLDASTESLSSLSRFR